MINSLFVYGVWVPIVLIIIGFVALVKGADWLVDGASAIAKRFGMDDLFIGLTVVAFGTSMPEFMVNMVSVVHGTTDLAITNILGSNIINTFVIVGLTALVYPIVSHRSTRNFDIHLSFMGCVGVYFAVTLPHVLGRQTACIDRLCGAGLLAFFIYFLFITFRNARAHKGETKEEQVGVKPIALPWAVCMIIGGILGLVLGGELIVDSAVNLAQRWGVSEAVIGLTIVALGTSLPELATSLVAAFKKNCDLAIGNVIGSNIFNIFFILGISAIIRPLPAYKGIEIDAFVAALGSLVVWLALKTRREHTLGRLTGIILLIIYAAYLTFRLMNPY